MFFHLHWYNWKTQWAGKFEPYLFNIGKCRCGKEKVKWIRTE